MKIADNIEYNTWLKKMSFIFFLMWCLAMSLGTSLRILTPWSYIDGHLIDFVTIFIYGTDVLVILFLSFWIVDILIKFWRYQDWDEWNIGVWPGFLMVIFWVLALWSSYSIFWAYDSSIALYKALRWWELFLIMAYILLGVGNAVKKWKYVWGFLTGGIVIQSIWGILQYWRQDDFGLWQLGESDIGKEVLGVAKIDVMGDKIVRAYGSLGHANLYSFYMLAGLILILTGIIYCRGGVFPPKKPPQAERMVMTKYHPYIWGILLGLISWGCLVGYSRSVWVAGMIVFVGFIIEVYGRGTFLRVLVSKENFKFKILNFKFWIIYLSMLAIGVIGNWGAIWQRLATGSDLGEDVSFNVRLFLNQAADWMIDRVYYIGVGIGNFVMVLSLYSNENLSWWMYQPVHNVFTLCQAELGVIGFLVYVALILVAGLSVLFSNVKNYPKYFWMATYLAFVWLHFFDHYIWDVWSGQILAVVFLGMLLIGSNYNLVNKKSDR